MILHEGTVRRGGMLAGFIAAILMFLMPMPAFATMPGDVPETIRFGLGGFAVEAFTEGSLSSSSAGLGATVNFEDVFDLPENTQILSFEGTWKIAKRQYIDFGYVKINRTGSTSIDQDVDWGDFTFQTGADVGAFFDTSFPYAAWRYDFLQLEQVRISGSAGIDYLTLSAGLRAEGNVTDPNGVLVSGEVDEQVSLAFPVPQFGLQVDWALTRRLAIKMYTRWLGINTGDLNGSIAQRTIRLYWYFSRHVGISGGLDDYGIDLKEYTSGNTTARFRYDVKGLSFYLTAAF